MLLTLDQTTVANMTAALEHSCKQIPPKKNSHVVRKATEDAMLVSANFGARSLPQLQEIGFAKLKGIVQPKKRGWRWWRVAGLPLVFAQCTEIRIEIDPDGRTCEGRCRTAKVRRRNLDVH
jgi:hypothetical protein